jgi:hypothetical protein
MGADVSLVEACEKRAFEIVQERAGKIRDLRTPLFHYTDANGLLGILECQRLRATDARYLNDPVELEYGRELFREVLRRYQIHEEVVAAASLGIVRGQAYLACFSEKGDLLSQWRAYANDGLGYSIGFHSDASWAHDATSRPLLLPVEYDKRKQLALLESIIQPLVDKLRNWDAASGALPPETTRLRAIIDPVLPMLKNPGFEEEREWRLVVPFDEMYSVAPDSFRASRFGISPFIELQTTNRLLPLAEIYMGPRVERDRGIVALVELLRARRYRPNAAWQHFEDMGVDANAPRNQVLVKWSRTAYA